MAPSTFTGRRNVTHLAALAAAVLATAGCHVDTPRTSFRYAEPRGTLQANGLRFVIMPDASTSQIEVDMRYEVGAREDPPGKAGLAHLVEHLMFEQHPEGPNAPSLQRTIERFATYSNASTDHDATHYEMAGRPDVLEELIQIEAYRLGLGCQTIPQDVFVREREVVRNELREARGDSIGMIEPLVLHDLYPARHAYARSVGGEDAELASITLADVCSFVERYYTPDRATLVIAGDVDVPATARMIAGWFGRIPRREAAPRVEVAQVLGASRGRVRHEVPIEHPVVVVAWPLPDETTRTGQEVGWEITDVSWRTAWEGARYDFAYQVQPMRLGGAYSPGFAIAVELASLDDVDEAVDAIRKYAARAHYGLHEGFAQQEADSRARRRAGYLRSIEDLRARTHKLADLVQFDRTTEFGSSDSYLLADLQRSEAIQYDDVRDAIEETMAWGHAKVMVFAPGGAEPRPAAAPSVAIRAYDRGGGEVDAAEASAPLAVAADYRALDGARRFELGNGLDVVLLARDSSLPLISAALMFDVGVASGDVPGLAGYTSAMSAWTPKSAAAGVGVGRDLERDTIMYTAGGLDLYLDEIIAALERRVKAGGYSQRSIEDWQKQIGKDFESHEHRIDVEYRHQLDALLYGDDHPYTRNESVRPADADKIGYDRVVDFQRDYFTAGHATLVIVGRFDPARAEALVRDRFDNWERGATSPAIAAAGPARDRPVFVGVADEAPRPMEVTIAYSAGAGVDLGEASRLVLAEMLQLRMQTIRTELGATYGMRAERPRTVGPGAYVIHGAIDPARAGEALAAMRAGLDALRRGEGFDEDFVRARRKVVQELLGEATVSARLVERLAVIARFDLSPDFYRGLVDQVANLTPADVKRVAARELDADTEVVVCRGRAADLARAFQQAGMSPARIVEPK